MRLEIGETINIPCEIGEGAFPGECLITVDTTLGPISGFVRTGDVKRAPGGSPYVVGIIEDVDGDTVAVRLKGSFFRTTGLTYLRKEAVLATA